MSQADLDLVRSTFEDFNRHGDVERAVRDFYTDDVEFEVSSQGGREDADFRVLHGHEETLAFFRDFLEPFDRVRYEVDDLVDLGPGEVLALLRVFLRPAGSDAEIMAQPFAYVLTLRGDRIARVQDFPDRAEAFRAVGFDPPAA